MNLGVKLACKPEFIENSPSVEHPMLLAQRRRARRYPSELLQFFECAKFPDNL